MSQYSNIEQLVARIAGLAEAARLDGPVVMTEIGEAYEDILKERADNQSGPFGVRWSDNDPGYAARKGNLPVGVLSGTMLDERNLRVDVSYANHRLYMRYDGSEEARQHLQWFQEGGRQLWGLDDRTRERFREIINGHIQDVVSNK